MSYGKTNYKETRKKLKEYNPGSNRVVCVGRTFGKKCKYCIEERRLRNSENEADRELYQSIRSKPVYYMTIFDLNNKKDGRQIFPCNITIWKALCDMGPDPNDPDDEGIDFTNIKKPHAVIIKRTGSGRTNTKYTVQISSKSTKFPKSLISKNPINLDKENLLKLIDEEKYKIWKPKEGKNKILIFPPWNKDQELFWSEIYYHWNIESLLLEDDEFDDDDEFDEDDEFEDEFENTGNDDDDEDYEEDYEEEDEDDGYDIPDFDEMNFKQLRTFAKKHNLISPKKLKKLKGNKLRKAVIKAWEDELED